MVWVSDSNIKKRKETRDNQQIQSIVEQVALKKAKKAIEKHKDPKLSMVELKMMDQKVRDPEKKKQIDTKHLGAKGSPIGPKFKVREPCRKVNKKKR